jgi:hypothetical protein
MRLLAPPTAICKADGSWQVLGQTQCECSTGYIPSLKTGLCTGLLSNFNFPPSQKLKKTIKKANTM